jgi:hypothetical protein
VRQGARVKVKSREADLIILLIIAVLLAECEAQAFTCEVLGVSGLDILGSLLLLFI